MIFTRNITEVISHVQKWRKKGLLIGFVPTMGALHEGHESLIKKASNENDIVVVSIFVNPLQFSENNDYISYPHNIDSDSIKCANCGTHLLFYPQMGEIYNDDFSTYVDMKGPTDTMCGENRDNHFRGVCTIVSKLFNIVTPDSAYFGMKDAQQVAVISKMVKDLNYNIKIVPCATVREFDGLAKSSRNVNLNVLERKAARVIYRSLLAAKAAIENGEVDPEIIKSIVKLEIIKEPLAKIEYIHLADSKTLKTVSQVRKGTLVAISVIIGNTRLIDNITF